MSDLLNPYNLINDCFVKFPISYPINVHIPPQQQSYYLPSKHELQSSNLYGKIDTILICLLIPRKFIICIYIFKINYSGKKLKFEKQDRIIVY